MLRRRGGTSRLTYRRLLDLIEQLPPESRTKTAQRDQLDPWELAALAEQDSAVGGGWGPHGRLHELLCMLGESIDRVGYYVACSNAGSSSKVKEPPRWRRPGVLGQTELALAVDAESAGTREQLEAERADREARRQAKKARRKAAGRGELPAGPPEDTPT